VLDALKATCGAQDTSSQIATFDRDAPLAAVAPEQVVQWYRASSFALSLDGYNNTAALPANAPASNTSAAPSMPDTPLPAAVSGTFLACLNSTIAAAVPLVAPPASAKLSPGVIAGIVIGSVVGVVLIGLALFCCVRSYRRRATRARGSTAAPAAAAAWKMPLARLFGGAKTRNNRGRYESLEDPNAPKPDLVMDDHAPPYAKNTPVPSMTLDEPFAPPGPGYRPAYETTYPSAGYSSPGYEPTYPRSPGYKTYDEPGPMGMPEAKIR
jgi:hypothetical protein